MFLPELGKQIQGERDLSLNNRIIQISARSKNRQSTVVKYLTRVKRVRHLINANDKILHITPALNDPKIINAVLINARRVTT